MKKLMILAGIATLAAAAPAVAKPDHANHGQGHAAHNMGAPMGYGVGHCPPGLAKKNNGCLPPGQAKKLYNRGQRWPGNYGQAWSYNQVPMDWRNQYDLNPYNRYYYGDGYLYAVDPKTQLISDVIRAIIR